MVQDSVTKSIRLATSEDASKILEIQREVLAENIYLMTTLQEFQQTVEQQRGWINAKLESERETVLVAEVNSEVVGWLVFQSPNRTRLSHTGTFGMMIKEEFRNLGIGKSMIAELLNWDQLNPSIEKVSLGVFSTNKNAIELYKKMGFVEEGRKIKEVKINEGTYLDDVLMCKVV